MGSSHLYVPGGNGVLFPLLCRLLFVPLPVSLQEETQPDQEGKTPDCTCLWFLGTGDERGYIEYKYTALENLVF